MNDSQTAKAGNSLPPTLGYPVGCVVKHCGWKIPRAGSWRYGLVLAHRDDVCCLQIDFGSYTAWVNPHAMMHLIRVDNTPMTGAAKGDAMTTSKRAMSRPVAGTRTRLWENQRRRKGQLTCRL